MSTKLISITTKVMDLGKAKTANVHFVAILRPIPEIFVQQRRVNAIHVPRSAIGPKSAVAGIKPRMPMPMVTAVSTRRKSFGIRKRVSERIAIECTKLRRATSLSLSKNLSLKHYPKYLHKCDPNRESHSRSNQKCL